MAQDIKISRVCTVESTLEADSGPVVHFLQDGSTLVRCGSWMLKPSDEWRLRREGQPDERVSIELVDSTKPTSLRSFQAGIATVAALLGVAVGAFGGAEISEILQARAARIAGERVLAREAFFDDEARADCELRWGADECRRRIETELKMFRGEDEEPPTNLELRRVLDL